MHSAFVLINNVPTMVTCWGKWIEETLLDGEHIVVMITGNPGVTSYYHTFLETVHARTGYHVWVLSHAGHEYPEHPTTLQMPSLKSNCALYDLQGQVNAKMEFIRKYVPAGCHVHLVGHSIGAYMCCQMLKEEDLNARIKKSYLLFPAIERIAKSPNGRFYTQIIQRIQFLLLFLAFVFAFVPRFLQEFLARCFCCLMGFASESSASMLTLVKPRVLRSVFFLADDEMVKVTKRDDVVALRKDKLLMYYGAVDGWAPVQYCQELQSDVPGIRAEVDTHGYQHAYVLRYSTEMGLLLSDWILQN